MNTKFVIAALTATSVTLVIAASVASNGAPTGAPAAAVDNEFAGKHILAFRNGPPGTSEVMAIRDASFQTRGNGTFLVGTQTAALKSAAQGYPLWINQADIRMFIVFDSEKEMTDRMSNSRKQQQQQPRETDGGL